MAVQDVQGHEHDILLPNQSSSAEGRIQTLIIGTHSRTLHDSCQEILRQRGYVVVVDLFENQFQPDGILTAQKGGR